MTANAATPARLPAMLSRVAAQRRQRRHLPPHALRQRGEERRDDDKQQRQQHRALDQHDALVGRAAREIDAAGGWDGDLEAEVVDRADHDRLQQREPAEQPRARLAPAGSRRRCRESWRAE